VGTEAPEWARRRDGGKPALALGTMNFGKRTPEAEAVRIVHRALDAGIVVLDTANAYNAGDSERILGRALNGRRNEAVIATKVGFGRRNGQPEGLSRQTILAAVDESLERLGTDWIDLYYVHVPDHRTPIDETLEAFQSLLQHGKVRHWGVSNYASWQIVEMIERGERAGMARPMVAQQLYNLLIRQLDLEYWRFAARYGLHTTVYNPLAGGLLTGRYRAGAAPIEGSRFDGNKLYLNRYFTRRMMELASSYEAVAREERMTIVELAYAWLARVPGVDSILVGPGSVAHLDEAIAAVQRTPSEDACKRIDAIHRDYLGTETSYAR
jgi:aryl-alcohol dehydrogenase-like predicted oxidoreductase